MLLLAGKIPAAAQQQVPADAPLQMPVGALAIAALLRPSHVDRARLDEVLEAICHGASGSGVGSADDDGKFSLGFRVTFDRSHSPTKLKVTCRVSKVTTAISSRSTPA